MIEFLILVVTLLVYAAILAAVIVVIIWALGVIGIVVPQKIIQIVWVIFALLVLLWVLRSMLGGGLYLPRLSMLGFDGSFRSLAVLGLAWIKT